MANMKKPLKKQKIRNSEYYDMQLVLDELYAASVKGQRFCNLLELIKRPENIKLAYRNIRKNSGSRTAGVDNKTISDLNKWNENALVAHVQRKLDWYVPNAVRRVEIPKDNGKTRPLGIPTIMDRLIQQCILQVLEPICEAKFFKRSNGFRPNHSAENAIAQAERMIQNVGCHYVIDIDIKSFFDNVNHGKLLKQMWTLGIRDKKLLSIISAMLKAEVAGIGFPEKGTPQGGIISPLLSNIVLNELDWWIVSQWEEMPTQRNYVHRIYANGTPDKSSTIRTLRNYTNLKECYVVRYADDFKIFCKKRSDAVKLFEATKQWLLERLGLETSPEKSKIVNLKRHYSEFLGFKLKVRTKGKKPDGQPRYVVEAHIKDKALQKIREKSKEIIGQIDTAHEGSGDDLTVSVKNIMNEAYCRDISIKTRTSLDIKRRNGDFVGAFPVYGYMKSEENKNLLVPDPYASRVVRDIFRMRLDGTSALRIATVLNEMGILSPLAYKKNNGFPYAKHGYADKEDCKWSATTIIRILQDETYIGTLVQGKQGTPHYKIKQMEQRPSSEWIRVSDAHEPLIAKQDFELVQRIRRLDTRTSPKQDTVYLFSGILICGCCGSRMTRKTNRVKGKEYHYYYCPTGKKHGCTNPVMLKESDLVECVKDSLKGYIDNVSCLQAILDGIDQSSINQALANEYASHIAANEQQVEQALEFKARLYESLITGTISKEEYTDYKAKYTRIAENAKESIRVLKEKLADVLENRSERNRWISHFTQFSTMETLDRKAVVHMIQSIKVIGKKELEITFTYQDEYQKAIQLIQLAEQTSQRKVG